MDEWTLNDLLECSVCLERLDTSSKVLPCQHTFCKKCLEEIVSTHKELRCPECRILVEADVEDLPPNVLLMRILEGMKNAGNPVPKKKANAFQKPQGNVQNSSQGSANQSYNNIENNKSPSAQKQNPLPTQPCARAIYDYISKEPGDLSFRKGDIILLHRKVDPQWYEGERGGKTGIFPLSYVQVLIPLLNQVATCRALYDFRMVNDEDEGCLSFRKDDVITVIRRVDENWAEGKLNDHIGIFPLAFVEMNNIAQALMKLSINSQPGPSRVAPPTPTTEESTPLIPTDHSGVISNCVNLHPPPQNNVGTTPHQNPTPRVPVTATTAISGAESGSTMSSSNSTPSSSSITPNSSSNTSSSSNSAPNSPPSGQPAHNPNPFLPPTQTPLQMILQTSHITNSTHGVLPTSHIMGQQSVGASEQPSADTHCLWGSPQPRDIPTLSQHPKEKRHSFSAVSTPNHHTCSNSNKHSPELPGSDSTPDSQNGHLVRHGSQRHRRSGSDLSTVVNLPAGYIALYPYKPQKADELELKKGGIYFVTERCQDGWFKGTSSKTQKSGVFPGNYVTLAKPLAAVQGQPRGTPTREPSTPAPLQKAVHQSKYMKATQMYGRQLAPPELPPRATSPYSRHSRIPPQNSSPSWHSPQNGVSGAQKSVAETSTPSPQPGTAAGLPEGRTSFSASASPVLSPSASKSAEKVKDKKEKSGLIKRLTTIKRSKSPPATASYSMDNPVFDDAPASSQLSPASHPHPVHLRSGSCPSQLIQVSPEGGSNHRILSASVSARLKHRERPSVSNVNFTHSTSRPLETTTFGKVSAGSSHRKSNSLDAGDVRKPRQLVPPVRERFRCVVPYPPNSEYELELKIGDIIYVHKKREDGWYKGTQQRTGRTGLFPASFVETY